MNRAPRVSHIGIAVADLEEATRFYRDVFGLEPSASEKADGAEIVSVDLGGTTVELLTSREPGSPIAKFLARRGPGIHHICFHVTDLDAALERCRQTGYRLIDEAPRLGVEGRRIAFLHPKSTAGILLELTD